MSALATISYTKTAQILHWLIALAVTFMLMLGWSFGYLSDGPTKFFLFQLHKSIGITILLLSLLRLGWRLAHRAPPLPAEMPLWERKAASLVHVLLYLLMIGMPLSGWALVSASPLNIPTVLYGVIPWPSLPIFSTLAHKKEAEEILGNVHYYAALLFALLIFGHVAAALKHHFITRDDILLRMMPQRWVSFFNQMRRQA